MKSSLIGKRIQVVVEEDGTTQPPRLPLATVVRRLRGPDRDDYFLLRLDGPVECVRADTGTRWVLRDLIIWSRYVGDSVDSLLAAPSTSSITVGIANLVAPLNRKRGRIDLSQMVYFGLGSVMLVR